MHPALKRLETQFQPSGLSRITDPLLEQKQVTLWLKRDDQLHPILSGNKWRKLKYSLNHALELGCRRLISMGGAYSNHLHALAYAGKALGLPTTAYIRGEPPTPLTPTLQDAQDWGMQLKFISRGDYRILRPYKAWDSLPGWQVGDYWLPEGGAQPLALQGVGELVAELAIPYQWLCVPCGTGATLAGLAAAVAPPSRVLGFAALKNAGFLRADIAQLLPQPQQNWHINLDYHCGGFAQTTPALLAFIRDFQATHGIALEPVYTGKMLLGLYELINNGVFAPGTTIIAVHTGGLQGNRGFPPCTDN
ncbi:1-aminocyclopropane-1-carboxylate deaminase/D-cysteine desulfhydrase [Methylovulum psychrotolerans]|uniref:1-aminocyclopropane-1-carboxylate deaminase n=1 Tax=Methylovulum psychrotolerans TaxID=1704499 RepID=A0A1Z4BZH6_9GAMM|nr:pyridoxal-phosphate dependent enzyme [Methylovulum psychrotolerans]ASF46688.1 1-aminocyclopropane-1-carboxylate deaminase [Methylovulum psychrotolerans]